MEEQWSSRGFGWEDSLRFPPAVRALPLQPRGPPCKGSPISPSLLLPALGNYVRVRRGTSGLVPTNDRAANLQPGSHQGCDHLFEDDDSYSLETPHSGHKEPRMPVGIW